MLASSFQRQSIQTGGRALVNFEPHSVWTRHLADLYVREAIFLLTLNDTLVTCIRTHHAILDQLE